MILRLSQDMQINNANGALSLKNLNNVNKLKSLEASNLTNKNMLRAVDR